MARAIIDLDAEIPNGALDLGEAFKGYQK